MSSNGSAERTVRSGPFFIQIDGLPPGYTWQELKDLIRPRASHSVWTDVSVNFRSHPRSQKGCIKLKLWNEAGAAYNYLRDPRACGRSLRVELWDITAPPPILLTRNYVTDYYNHNYQIQEVVRLVQDRNAWMDMPPASPVPATSASALTASMAQMSLASSMQATQQYGTQVVPSTQPTPQQVQAYYTPTQLAALQAYQVRARQIAVDQQRAQAPAAYATSSSGLPVNTRNGTAKTEARGIFVSRLNYRAKERDIEKLFSQVGKVMSCKLQKDPKSKSKGNAQLMFESAEEANRAIKEFDGKVYMDMKLAVRSDRDTVTIAPPPRSDSRPLIVDSSMAAART